MFKSYLQHFSYKEIQFDKFCLALKLRTQDITLTFTAPHEVEAKAID